MGRLEKRERRQAKLQCNNCEQQFVGLAWFVSIESPARGTLGRNIDTDGTRGAMCPSCGSELIRYIRT